MAFQVKVTVVDDLALPQRVIQVQIERAFYGHTRAEVVLRWQEQTRYDDRRAATMSAKMMNCPVDV